MPTSPLLEAPVHTGDALCIERTDIRFFNLRPDRVCLEITIRNEGDAPSPPTPVVLAAAPLGAFVPWRPLTILAAPILGAGRSTVLRTEIDRDRPVALGSPDRVPPRRLLTALGAADDRSGRAGNPGSLWQRILRDASKTLARQGKTRTRGVGLPDDPAELLGRSNPHWAGNLNVFVHKTAVERHLAQALRIYPGRLNMAMFVLGDGRKDAYAFHLTGEGACWDARLYDATERETLSLTVGSDGAISEKEWLEVSGPRMMMLSLCPPRVCRRGTVEVNVEQRSSGKTAVVEFSLDPDAAGPGCFVV